MVTLDTDGEPALIPSEMMRYSLDRASSVDVDASLCVLGSPGQPACDVVGFEKADAIIRLVGDVFKLGEVEKRAMEAGEGAAHM